MFIIQYKVFHVCTESNESERLTLVKSFSYMQLLDFFTFRIFFKYDITLLKVKVLKLFLHSDDHFWFHKEPLSQKVVISFLTFYNLKKPKRTVL